MEVYAERHNGRQLSRVEGLFWVALKDLASTNGLQFEIQFPLFGYIADFCCLSAMVVIEIDGSDHDHALDDRRDKELRAHGFRTVRVPNGDVERDPQHAASTVVEVALARIAPARTGEDGLRQTWTCLVCRGPIPRGTPLADVVWVRNGKNPSWAHRKGWVGCTGAFDVGDGRVPPAPQTPTTPALSERSEERVGSSLGARAHAFRGVADATSGVADPTADATSGSSREPTSGVADATSGVADAPPLALPGPIHAGPDPRRLHLLEPLGVGVRLLTIRAELPPHQSVSSGVLEITATIRDDQHVAHPLNAGGIRWLKAALNLEER